MKCIKEMKQRPHKNLWVDGWNETLIYRNNLSKFVPNYYLDVSIWENNLCVIYVCIYRHVLNPKGSMTIVGFDGI